MNGSVRGLHKPAYIFPRINRPTINYVGNYGRAVSIKKQRTASNARKLQAASEKFGKGEGGGGGGGGWEFAPQPLATDSRYVNFPMNMRYIKTV